MTKRYEAVVLAIGPVEGEVLLLVKGLEIECFASYCPSKIEVGETYEVEFELVLPDNDVVAAAEEPLTTLIEMTNNGFSCALYGYLDGDVFRSFVDFSDQDIHYDLPHLNGRFVKIQVDRIDVSF
ncbi:hypothetical protein [Pseudomonas fluorescens]|uniref:Uncharacterized protein n=1 Tax=Pseudomonas fluorescens TaxID=294 RepID=A0A5E7K8W9_PSEFL|nr:hypothetical protein [Pseudomonas fluorescens]VVO97090.1 hypothetical protein PS880_02614 [Pseudomonas fluorescens]